MVIEVKDEDGGRDVQSDVHVFEIGWDEGACSIRPTVNGGKFTHGGMGVATFG